MIRRLGRWALGAMAIVFGCVGYGYLTLPDVRVLATENPTSTAFTELRAREARADGKTPKHVQKWIAYRRISPALARCSSASSARRETTRLLPPCVYSVIRNAYARPTYWAGSDVRTTSI